MPDRPSGQDRPTADYPLPKGYLSNAHHHYLFHPGYPEVYRDDAQMKTTETDPMEWAGTKAGSQRLGGSFQPGRDPISKTCTSNSTSASASASTSTSTSKSGSTPTLQVKPDPGLSSTHFRIPNESDLQSHPEIRTLPRETAGPGPRTTEIRERVRMREHTIPRHSLGSDLDGRRGRGEGGGVAGKGYGREDEMDMDIEMEMEAEGVDANGNGNEDEDRASKTPTAIPDGLDVKDILQTYRALRDRLPDVFPRRGVGTTQPLFVAKPNESTDKSPEGQNAKKGVGTTAPGDKDKEKEELREILRLAMEGFKLVGSVFADKSNSADRWERRPATEPSGSKRDRGAGYGSFARERAERGRPTTGPAGRSCEWSEAEMSARSPVGTDAGEFAATARGHGSAPSLGVSFSSASTTPVSQANLTPNFGPQELPHRATSGASSNSKSARMDVESSPLEEAFLVERPNSSNATANTGQAQGGQGGVVAGNPVCLGCGATETPEWRRGPMGPRTLCNACGLVFAKLVRKRAREAAKAQAIAKGLLPPKKSRSKKAKLSLVEEVTEA